MECPSAAVGPGDTKSREIHRLHQRETGVVVRLLERAGPQKLGATDRALLMSAMPLTAAGKRTSPMVRVGQKQTSIWATQFPEDHYMRKRSETLRGGGMPGADVRPRADVRLVRRIIPVIMRNVSKVIEAHDHKPHHWSVCFVAAADASRRRPSAASKCASLRGSRIPELS
jgi:hypothetical protein